VDDLIFEEGATNRKLYLGKERKEMYTNTEGTIAYHGTRNRRIGKEQLSVLSGRSDAYPESGTKMAFYGKGKRVA
jgi:hypothetical protein